MDFQFPICKADGNQFKDAEELYKELEKETSGHYLLGSHGFWHGGIHISDKSAPQCKVHEPVRCIADGEVVAYRLNKNHLASTYKGETLSYSSSFCLVRHRYESLKNQTEGPHKDKQNKLTFYSLYMHLLPHASYPVTADEVKRRVKVTASELRARSENSLSTPALGYIETGAELEIVSVQPEYRKNPGDTTTYELAETLILKKTVKDGGTVKAKTGDTIWLALSKQDAGGPKQPFVTDLPLPERKQPAYWQGKVRGTVIKEVNARQAPAGEEAGAGIGVLAPMSTELEFDTASIRLLKVGEQSALMAECRLLSGGLKGAGTLPSTFWVCVESKFIQRKAVTTEQFDTVVACSVPIKAGDPIGFLGLYETPKPSGGKTTKHQVHLEVFSNDSQLEDFLKNTAGLTEGKQYLRIAKNKQLSNKSGTDAAPTFAPTGSPLTEDCLVELSKASTLKDASGKDWFGATVQNGATAISGFIAKDQTEVITQHDWEKLGFSIVKEQNENADGFLDPEQMPPFFSTLYKEIDRQGNNDGQVNPAELTVAMRNPDLRERWSKLIAYHPTEWQAKSDQPKWQRLKELLSEAPELLKHEQERIDNLVFWDSIATAIPALANPCVHHLHPLAALDMFLQRSHLIDVERFIEKYTSQHESFMANTPAFSQVSKGNLRTIVEYINKYYESDPGKANLFELAYMFATARHEAYYFPNGEFFSSKPEVGGLDYFNKYDPVLANTQTRRDTAVANENTVQGDGYKYRGRGLVHLTWKTNYRKAKEHFGVDFVTAPEKAAEPEHSVPIMIWGMTEGIFTHKKLARYINSSGVDYVNARFIINPDENGPLIAGYAQKFESILRETSSAKETFTL